MWNRPRDHRIVGEILATARRRQDVTQVELAQRLSKPQSFVSAFESGQRRVDTLELLRIADALSISPSDIFQEIVRAFEGRRL